MAQYPSLYLKPGRERSVLNRHPWLYTGAIARTDSAQTGSIVSVRNSANEIIAYGHYNAQSQIVCRLFEFSLEKTDFSDSYWQQKIDTAIAFRKKHLRKEITNGYRLINAEGDGMPGIIIDVYDTTAVLQLRTPGTRNLLPVITEHLKSLGFEHIFDKSLFGEGKYDEPDDTKTGGGWVAGGIQEVQFLENGFRFYSAPDQGQKTGYYLDQRDNRYLVQQFASGRTVLDAFTYAGGFGIYALQGGARKVVSVDASETAIQLCKRNVASNFDQENRHTALVADCFDYLRTMPSGEFDCIVLDPPAFTKHISTVKKAARGYKDINYHAIRRIAPGGILFTFSCSQHISTDLFRKIAFSAAADARRDVRILAQLGQPLDHPISIYHPEGEYLKGLVLGVD
jgi:23S rRNA (cytosine1962-C5)-methyltransferase